MRLTFFEQVRGGEVGVLASTSRSAKGVRWKCIPRVRVEATRHQRAVTYYLARRSRRAGSGARVGASVVGGSEIGAQRIWWQERCLAREGCRARNDQADRRGPGHRSAKTWPRTRTRIWVSTRRRCSPWRRRWSMRPAKRMALRLLTRRWLRASPRRSSLPARSSGRGQRCRRWTRRRTR